MWIAILRQHYGNLTRIIFWNVLTARSLRWLFCVEAACSPRRFSLCVGSLGTHTPKTCVRGWFEPVALNWLEVWMCVYARPSVYVGPARSWWLIQGAPRLSPEGSWDGLQFQALGRRMVGYLKWVRVCLWEAKTVSNPRFILEATAKLSSFIGVW